VAPRDVIYQFHHFGSCFAPFRCPALYGGLYSVFPIRGSYFQSSFRIYDVASPRKTAETITWRHHHFPAIIPIASLSKPPDCQLITSVFRSGYIFWHYYIICFISEVLHGHSSGPRRYHRLTFPILSDSIIPLLLPFKYELLSIKSNVLRQF